MMHGIAGGPLPASLPFAPPIQRACAEYPNGFSPVLAYAIAFNETIGGQLAGLWPDAATIISPDGGHGLFQLTSWVPAGWSDPLENARMAVAHWLAPAAHYWTTSWQLTGPDLIRAIAAEFNAGRGDYSPTGRGALGGHYRHDVDLYTTDHYAMRALEHYQRLISNRDPDHTAGRRL